MENSLSQGAQKVYTNIVAKKTMLIAALVAGILVSVVINVFVGSSGLTAAQTWNALIWLNNSTENLIVWDIRMPMALAAVFVGAALGMAGCGMQTILRNPMASAFTLGLSSAASLGASLAIVLKISIIGVAGNYIIVANAMLFTMLAALLVIAFSKRYGSDRGILILFGIALNFMFGAFTTILQYIANETDLQSVVFWTFGNLTKIVWENLCVIMAVTIICFFLLARKAWSLTAMSLSDINAQSLGIDVGKLRRSTILIAAMLAATCVSFAGPIAFIGLVAPHIARMLGGEDQRFLLPLSALMGSFVLSIASIFSKIIIPGTILPIGLITSVIGIPFFLVLILQRKRSYM
jgi:iron complex transport system permease protein